MQKKLMPRTFRPWETNHKRLEFAGKMGLNVSELINEVLEKHLEPVMEQKADTIRKTLSKFS